MVQPRTARKAEGAIILLAVIAANAWIGPGQAQPGAFEAPEQCLETIFEDDFDYPEVAPALDWDPEEAGAPWILYEGGIDLIGPGLYDWHPGNGTYVDLAGTAETGTTVLSSGHGLIPLVPGFYLLQVRMGGSSQGGDSNKVNVSVSDAFIETFTFAWTTPVAIHERTFSVSDTTDHWITFTHLGGDASGVILHGVRICRIEAPARATESGPAEDVAPRSATRIDVADGGPVTGVTIRNARSTGIQASVQVSTLDAPPAGAGAPKGTVLGLFEIRSSVTGNVANAEPVGQGNVDNAEPLSNADLYTAEPLGRVYLASQEVFKGIVLNPAEPVDRPTLDGAEPVDVGEPDSAEPLSRPDAFLVSLEDPTASIPVRYLDPCCAVVVFADGSGEVISSADSGVRLPFSGMGSCCTVQPSSVSRVSLGSSSDAQDRIDVQPLDPCCALTFLGPTGALRLAASTDPSAAIEYHPLEPCCAVKGDAATGLVRVLGLDDLNVELQIDNLDPCCATASVDLGGGCCAIVFDRSSGAIRVDALPSAAATTHAIEFGVTAATLREANVAESDVVLQHFNGASWEPAYAEPLSAGGGRFRSEVLGFSPFAIVVDETAPEIRMSHHGSRVVGTFVDDIGVDPETLMVKVAAVIVPAESIQTDARGFWFDAPEGDGPIVATVKDFAGRSATATVTGEEATGNTSGGVGLLGLLGAAGLTVAIVARHRRQRLAPV